MPEDHMLPPAEKPVAVQRRTIIYVDGFNLFYGAIEGSQNKWLDLDKYFKMLRSNETILKIKYFTAIMSGPKGTRQSVYLDALRTFPSIEVIVGRYKTKDRLCGVKHCEHDGDRGFTSLEEKRTDVSIAVHMLDDAHRGICDVLVLVTGDSDLVPAVEMIRSGFPKKIISVYVPNRRKGIGSTEIRQAATKQKDLPLDLLSKALLPAQLADGKGGMISKPAGW